MAAPRKIFRIEETAGLVGRARAESAAAASRHGQYPRSRESSWSGGNGAAAGAASFGASAGEDFEALLAELRLVLAAVGRAPDEQSGRNGGGGATPATHTALELDAVLKGSEQAAQKILAAAEDIDQVANNLSAALRGDLEQGLTQDIRDRVIEIFEACNFQDINGQRVAKVLNALQHVEEQIARAIRTIEQAGAPPMHGPRLDDNDGHFSQGDIDAMFDV